MNLILLEPSEMDDSGNVILSGDRARHILKVLRAEPGKALRIGSLNGPLGTGTIQSINGPSVELECNFEACVPPRPSVDLLLAMPRPKVLKRLWSQFAALGVGRIVITGAQKVEKYYFDTHILSPEFYRPKLIEGLQQARDTHFPEVTIIKNLRRFLDQGPHAPAQLVADPSGTRSVFQTLENVPAERALIAIGPEGGWVPSELEMFEQHGFETVGMGRRILRTDTACIALISLLAEGLNKSV